MRRAGGVATTEGFLIKSVVSQGVIESGHGLLEDHSVLVDSEARRVFGVRFERTRHGEVRNIGRFPVVPANLEAIIKYQSEFLMS